MRGPITDHERWTDELRRVAEGERPASTLSTRQLFVVITAAIGVIAFLLVRFHA